MTDFPDRPKQSNFKTTLASPINNSQTSGIILSAVPDYSSGGETTTFTILNSKGVEHITATGWNSSTKELSGVTRGVASYTGGGSTARAHGGGVVVVLGNPWQIYDDVNTALTSKADLAGDTFTGKVDFSGTGHQGIVTNNLTTAQLTAIGGDNGGVAYDTTLGEVVFREGGAWVQKSGGGSVPNAADNTAGKVDIASATEIGAGTATDATSGAINVIPVSQTVKTSSGAGDENKLPILNSSGQLAAGFLDLTGKTDKSTLTTKGDIYAASAASTPARLGVGSDGQVLTAASGETTGLTWATPASTFADYGTSGAISTSTNTDVTITPGFQAGVIRLVVGGQIPGTNTGYYQGELVFDGTTFVFASYRESDSGVAASANYLTYDKTITNTNPTSVFRSSGTANWIINFSITNITSTSFDVRITSTKTNSPSDVTVNFGVIASPA